MQTIKSHAKSKKHVNQCKVNAAQFSVIRFFRWQQHFVISQLLLKKVMTRYLKQFQRISTQLLLILHYKTECQSRNKLGIKILLSSHFLRFMNKFE